MWMRGSRVSTNSADAISSPRAFLTNRQPNRSARLFRRMICLDTNIAIYVINRRVPTVRLRLAEQLRLGTEIGFSVIALFELRYGHARSDRRANPIGCWPSFWRRGPRCFHSKRKTPHMQATSEQISKARARRSVPMIVSLQPRRAAGAPRW